MHARIAMPLLTVLLMGITGCRIESSASTDTPTANTSGIQETQPEDTAIPTSDPTATIQPDTPTENPETDEPPRDQEVPEITLNEQPQVVEVGKSVVISATITDNIAVLRSTLYYRTVGDDDFDSTTMVEDRLPDVYIATIPGSFAQIPGVEYYVSARDVSGNVGELPEDGAEEPYSYDVLDELPTPSAPPITPTAPPATPTAITLTAPPETEPPETPQATPTLSSENTPTVESTDAPPTSGVTPWPTEPGATATETLPTQDTATASATPFETESLGQPTPSFAQATPTEEPTATRIPTPTEVPTPWPTPGGEPSLLDYPQAIQVGQSFDFQIRGGTPPFAFAFVSNKSGGTVDSSSGSYQGGGQEGTDLISITDRLNYTLYATVEVERCKGEDVTMSRDNGVARYFVSGDVGDQVAMPVPVHDASFTPESVGLFFSGITPGPSAPQFKVSIHIDDNGTPGQTVATSDFEPVLTVSATEAQIFALTASPAAFVSGSTMWIVVEYGAFVEEGGVLFDDGRFNSGSYTLLNRGSGWSQITIQAESFESTGTADSLSPMFRATGCHVPQLTTEYGGERITLITNDPDLEGRPLGMTYYPQGEGAQLAERFYVSTSSFELTHIRATFLDGAAWSQANGRFKVDIYTEFDGEPDLILSSSPIEQVSVAYPEYHTFTLETPVYLLPGQAFWAVFTTVDDQILNSFGMVADNGNRENNETTFSRRTALSRDSVKGLWQPIGALIQESLLAEAIGRSVEGHKLGSVLRTNMSLTKSDCAMALKDHTQYWSLDTHRDLIWQYSSYAYRPTWMATDLNANSASYLSHNLQSSTEDGAIQYAHSGNLVQSTDFSGEHTLVVQNGSNPNYPDCTATWSFAASAL